MKTQVNEQAIYNGKTTTEIISDYAKMIKSHQPNVQLLKVLELVDDMLDLWNIAKSPRERYQYHVAAREGYEQA